MEKKEKFSYQAVVRFLGKSDTDERLVFVGSCSSDEIEDVLSSVHDTSMYHKNQFLPEFEVNYFIESFNYSINSIENGTKESKKN